MSKELQRFVQGWNEGIIVPAPMPELKKFFCNSLWESFEKQFTTKTPEQNQLPRASELGKPAILTAARWLGLNVETEYKRALTQSWIFSVGDIFETYLLTLLALHDNHVTCLQQEVNFMGASGHIDAVCNGRLIEIKTMSDYYFRRFVDEQDDERGYLTQLHIYAYCRGTKEASWLLLNKQTNELLEVELDWDDYYIDRAQYIIESLPHIKTKNDILKFFDKPKPVWNKTKRRYELPWSIRDCPLKYELYPLETDGYTVIM